ncbi:MAG: ATP-binding protein [Candidatus Saccharimonas sp.]
MLVTLVVGVLFAWSEFGNLKSLNAELVIPFATGILAIVTFIVVLVSYFVAPLQQLRLSTYLNYTLSALTVLVLVVETGGVQSPYLSFLIATLPFASLIGVSGAISAAILYVGFITYEYLVIGLTLGQTIQLSTVGGLALLAGILLWIRSDDKEDSKSKEDRSYHELANQLSQVSGKSEVVINAIGDGVIALNSKGVVQLINPAAERITGWSNHDALNLGYKAVLKLLNTKNQLVEDMSNPIARVLDTNKTVKTDSFSIETRSGKSFIAAISISPVGKHGDGVIVVFRDITAEKSDERQRAEFISTASHEMRTPVASIEGYLGLVLNPKITTIDDKARDYITKAHASAQHLGRLFADLLDVSKADDSRLKNDPKVVDVIPFIHDIVEGLTPKAVEKGLVVFYKPIPDNSDRKVELLSRRLTPVYYAKVDNDHLREIIQNLVENAIKYTLKGSVTVDIGGDESHVLISITDTGIGIPREDQSHLFQKFYRVDNTDTREIGGTGLGLYLCRRLTETIGGRLWVESEYQHGSTFFVEIPRIDHDEAMRLIEQSSIDAERTTQSPPTNTTPEQPLTDNQAEAIVAFGTPEQQKLPNTTASSATPSEPTRIPVASGITVTAAESAPTQVSITPGPGAMPAPDSPRQQQAAQTEPESVQDHTNSQAEPANTPLTSIEADPRQYIVNKRSQPIQIAIPERK